MSETKMKKGEGNGGEQRDVYNILKDENNAEISPGILGYARESSEE